MAASRVISAVAELLVFRRGLTVSLVSLTMTDVNTQCIPIRRWDKIHLTVVVITCSLKPTQ